MRSVFWAAVTSLFLATNSVADDKANAALIAALEAGDKAALSLALEQGADANTKTDKGAPALIAAALQKKPDLARTLMEAGADLDAQYMDYIGANALMVAVQNKDLSLAEDLLIGGANVNLADTNGDPAINWAAYYGYTDFVSLFLKNGASTQLVGHGTPREIAMRRGFQDLVLMLARHEKQPIPTPDEAMLVDAVQAGDFDAVMEALIIGVSPNIKDFSGRPVLALAARRGNVEIIAALVNKGAQVDGVDQIGFTPLMEAARDNKLEAAKYLIEAGANINHVGVSNGMSLGVIHMAALSNNPVMVSMIANAGADLDIQGRDGGTALAWCLGERKNNAAIKLLELGANPYLKSKYGYSAADFITASDNEALKGLLKPQADFTS